MQTLTSSDWRAASDESVRRLEAGEWRDTDRRLRNLLAVPNLPTLRASDAERGQRNTGANAQGGPNLRESLLPTLTVKGNYNRKGLSPNSGDGLVTALLPTMRASDWRSGNTSTATQESNARPLPEVLTTASPPGSGSLLDPGWCEEFMNFPLGWTEPVEVDGPPPEFVKRESADSETPSSPKSPKRSAG
jgi:hypothetical protein